MDRDVVLDSVYWFVGASGLSFLHMEIGCCGAGRDCSVAYLSERQSIMTDRKRVLILCTGNSARSQMAEGLLRHDAGDRFEVVSAGVDPSEVRPLAVRAMREVGIDIAHQRSKSVDEFTGQKFDYVITVCDNANQQCPMFPGNSKRIHWNIEDPASAVGGEEERLKVFQRVRDELRERLREFGD